MNITRAGSPVSKRGPAEYFTGTVWLDEIAAGPNESRVRALRVSFEPGARTAWHTHPFGQVLHIISGVGRVQKAGADPVEVYPGDTVWFEPGERHWHGAAPNRFMVHLAVQQTDAAGQSADWFEHVIDEDYSRRGA
jgi:quercetin dioxygenase-like cupin family protein